MGGGRCFANATFEIRNSDHFGRQTFGPVGQVFFRLGSGIAEMRAQGMHFVQREPFGATRCLGPALRQFWVLFQHAAEMGLGYGDQIAGDFPGGKQTQLARAFFR